MNKTDWSGVAKIQQQVLPLTAETFVERLRLLSARVHDIQVLRAKMRANQQKS